MNERPVVRAENRKLLEPYACLLARVHQRIQDMNDGELDKLDAAVKVLSESKVSMTTKAMIDAMGTKGYWTSPGGKTPAQTLYSALLREIQNKGKDARIVKVDRGQFALKK